MAQFQLTLIEPSREERRQALNDRLRNILHDLVIRTDRPATLFEFPGHVLLHRISGEPEFFARIFDARKLIERVWTWQA